MIQQAHNVANSATAHRSLTQDLIAPEHSKPGETMTTCLVSAQGSRGGDRPNPREKADAAAAR